MFVFIYFRRFLIFCLTLFLRVTDEKAPKAEGPPAHSLVEELIVNRSL